MPTIDIPFRSHPLVFPAQLLSKAIIRQAATNSAASTTGVIARQGDRNRYIITLLEEAPPDMQVAVKNMALASDSEGQKQLGCLLALFLTLSPERKVDFIDSYKACATLVGQGAIETVQHNAWQPGHVPPYINP